MLERKETSEVIISELKLTREVGEELLRTNAEVRQAFLKCMDSIESEFRASESESSDAGQ